METCIPIDIADCEIMGFFELQGRVLVNMCI